MNANTLVRSRTMRQPSLRSELAGLIDDRRREIVARAEQAYAWALAGESSSVDVQFDAIIDEMEFLVALMRALAEN